MNARREYEPAVDICTSKLFSGHNLASGSLYQRWATQKDGSVAYIVNTKNYRRYMLVL
jgi:hypothetical protein